MNTSRSFILVGALLLSAGIGLAAALDRWYMSWPGNRAAELSPLQTAIGDGQKIFAGHFYRKADVYFHSGMYPSIFDGPQANQAERIGQDAGLVGSTGAADGHELLAAPRDIIERFSRHFFPSQHTHLDAVTAGEHHTHDGDHDHHGHGHDHSHTHDHGHSHDHDHDHGHSHSHDEHGAGAAGEVREVLPWLKIAQELDPENPLTYTVTAYWLRVRMNKPREAELLLREGLRHLPNHPVLLFEMGRLHYQPLADETARTQQDLDRARNIWRHAVRAWQQQQLGQPEPDLFILEQLLTHLGKLEEDAGNLARSLEFWEQARTLAPQREGIPQRIAELREKLSASQRTP
jgi:tetratricopeptide (TPR) repeat protein